MKMFKFYAQWCGPCKQQAKEFEEHPVNVEVESIDIDDDAEDLVSKYHVMSIPTLILLDENDELLKRWTGFTKSENINKFINGQLSTTSGDASDASEDM